MSASTMPDWILFSLHWLVSLFGRMMASFSSLETKDFATLAVSLIALIVSVVSVRQSISSRKKDAERSARAEFAEIVETMVDLRQKREDIRRELGVEWGKNNNVVTRININDKRELLISRAAYLLHNFDINVSDIQYTIVGVAVVDAGDLLNCYNILENLLRFALTRLRARWRDAVMDELLYYLAI